MNLNDNSKSGEEVQFKIELQNSMTYNQVADLVKKLRNDGWQVEERANSSTILVGGKQ